MTRQRSLDVETHEDEVLRSALDALVREEGGIAAPPHLEAAVMRAWDRDHRPADVGRAGAWWRRAAIAAAIILSCGLWLAREQGGVGLVPALPPGPERAVLPPAPSSVPAVDIAEATPPRKHRARAPAAAAAPMSRTPEPSAMLVLVGTPFTGDEQVHVVRMRMDRAALAGMGLRPLDGDATSTVDVELLVGEDGVARALRLRM